MHIYNIHTCLHARQSIVQVFSKHVFLHSLHYKRIVQNRWVHPNQPSKVGYIQGFHHGSDAWRKAAEKHQRVSLENPYVMRLCYDPLWNLGKMSGVSSYCCFFLCELGFPRTWLASRPFLTALSRAVTWLQPCLNFDSKIGGGTVSSHLPRIVAG